MKLVLGITVGLAVALLAGWVWGSAGRSEMARALETSELRGELRGARAAVLDARVAIYSVNFGEASAHLEGARSLLRHAAERRRQSYNLRRSAPLDQHHRSFLGVGDRDASPRMNESRVQRGGG